MLPRAQNHMRMISTSRAAAAAAASNAVDSAPCGGGDASPYVVMATMTIKEHYLDRFIDFSISDGLDSVLTEPGCRRFDIIQDHEQKNKFLMVEAYDNKDSFTAHLASEHFMKWHRAVRPTFLVEPEVTFARLLHPGHANMDSLNKEHIDDHAFGTKLIRHTSHTIDSDFLNEYLSRLLQEANDASKDDNCLRFDVYQNIENPQEILSYEIFEDNDAYQQHQQLPSAVDRMTKGKEWSETQTVLQLPQQQQPNAVSSSSSSSSCRDPLVLKGRNIWPPDSWNFHSYHNPSGIVFQRQNSVELQNHLKAKAKH